MEATLSLLSPFINSIGKDCVCVCFIKEIMSECPAIIRNMIIKKNMMFSVHSKASANKTSYIE